MSANKDYVQHWDAKFASRPWGRYPPEDFVRFMGRNFRDATKAEVKVLEVGCGPGANLWFLQREGFAAHGIDASPTAVELAARRLAIENAGLSSPRPDLRTGNFAELPWGDDTFDVVADIFSLYANPVGVIEQTLRQIDRVLKPDGLFYSKLWGRNTTGYGEGTPIEDGTFDDIPRGPCRGMGISHFFSHDEVDLMFGRHFQPVAIDRVLRTDAAAGWQVEEFHCQFRKPAEGLPRR